MPKDRETIRRSAQIATSRVFSDHNTTLMQLAVKIISIEQKIDIIISAVSNLEPDQGKKL